MMFSINLFHAQTEFIEYAVARILREPPLPHERKKERMHTRLRKKLVNYAYKPGIMTNNIQIYRIINEQYSCSCTPAVFR